MGIENRESLKDENYKGDDILVDVSLENGPLHNRRFTDIICLLVFIIFCGFYGSTVLYGFKNGRPEKLLRPVNGDGLLCGVGGLDDYPYLFFIMKRSNKEMRAVCVKKCPRESNDTVECYGTQYVKKEQCRDPKYLLGYGTIRVLNRFCLPDPDKFPKELDNEYDNMVGSFGLDDVSEFVQDLDEAKYAFVITFVTCIFVTIVYAFLVYSCTGLLVWVSIIGTGMGILGLAHMV